TAHTSSSVQPATTKNRPALLTVVFLHHDHDSAAISDARTLRVPEKVRRPCMVTKLSTRATSPCCQGTSKDSSSPSLAAVIAESRSSGLPSPKVIDLVGSLRLSFQPWKAAISWLKNALRPFGSSRTAGSTGVVARRQPSGSQSHE